MSKSKFVSSIFLSLFLLLIFSISTKAALITVNPQGKIIWQVLGDSTIEVKKVAQNTNESQIALTNDNGTTKLNGIDVSNFKDTLIELEARPDSSDLKISGSNGTFSIEENGVTAQTQFPITIDAAKNELSVTTATGDRVIAILPYEAVQSLMRANYINKVNQNQINLDESSKGELQYKVDGIKNINLFNIANIDAKVSSNVSATTGEILKLDQPQWLKFFGFVFNN